jgi:hypothetical protein
MQLRHEKERCRGTATQLQIAEKLDVVEVSASCGTTNHGLDTVEVSAPSKTKEEKRPVLEEPVTQKHRPPQSE